MPSRDNQQGYVQWCVNGNVRCGAARVLKNAVLYRDGASGQDQADRVPLQDADLHWSPLGICQGLSP